MTAHWGKANSSDSRSGSHQAWLGKNTCPASNLADATAMRVTLSLSGFTANDPRDTADEFLHQGNARSGFLNQNAFCPQSHCEMDDLCLQRGVIVSTAPNLNQVKRVPRVTIQVVQTEKSFSGPPLLAVSQLWTTMSRSDFGGSSS